MPFRLPAWHGVAESEDLAVVVDILTLLALLGTITAGYVAWNRLGERPTDTTSDTEVDILLEYRNAKGFQTQRKVRVVGYVPRPGGRSCLFAVAGGAEPRTFRIDRIVSIATLDGEIIDVQQFLANHLGVGPFAR